MLYLNISQLLEKLSCSLDSAHFLAKGSIRAALEAMHTRMYAFLRWRADRKHISESLEHLASYNGADMYKYNMLYTLNLNQHVLTPESRYTKRTARTMSLISDDIAARSPFY